MKQNNRADYWGKKQGEKKKNGICHVASVEKIVRGTTIIPSRRKQKAGGKGRGSSTPTALFGTCVRSLLIDWPVCSSLSHHMPSRTRLYRFTLCVCKRCDIVDVSINTYILALLCDTQRSRNTECKGMDVKQKNVSNKESLICSTLHHRPTSITSHNDTHATRTQGESQKHTSAPHMSRRMKKKNVSTHRNPARKKVTKINPGTE